MASEYGWAMHDIFERVYFDELFFLVEKINARKLTEYKMHLAIVQNPHVKDPKHLWKLLEEQDHLAGKRKKVEETFDETGFEHLKSVMRQNPRMVVK